jgi:hypothetical protein
MVQIEFVATDKNIEELGIPYETWQNEKGEYEWRVNLWHKTEEEYKKIEKFLDGVYVNLDELDYITFY